MGTQLRTLDFTRVLVLHDIFSQRMLVNIGISCVLVLVKQVVFLALANDLRFGQRLIARHHKRIAVTIEDIDNVDYSHPGFNIDETFKDVDFNNFTFSYKDIKEHVLNTSFAPWTKLYKSELLNRYDDFRFPTDVAFDDTPFHVQSMLRAERISFVPKFFYFYRFNPNSVNNTSSNGMDIFRICDIVEEFLKENGYYDEFIEEFKYFKIKQIFNYIMSTGTEEYFKLAKEELLAIDIDEDNIIPAYLMKEYNMITTSDSFTDYKDKKTNKVEDKKEIKNGKVKSVFKKVRGLF